MIGIGYSSLAIAMKLRYGTPSAGGSSDGSSSAGGFGYLYHVVNATGESMSVDLSKVGSQNLQPFTFLALGRVSTHDLLSFSAVSMERAATHNLLPLTTLSMERAATHDLVTLV